MSDKRDTFNFQIHRTPSVTSNVPFISFYSSAMSEFVRTARSTLLLNQMISGDSGKRHAKRYRGFSETSYYGFRYCK